MNVFPNSNRKKVIPEKPEFEPELSFDPFDDDNVFPVRVGTKFRKNVFLAKNCIHFVIFDV